MTSSSRGLKEDVEKLQNEHLELKARLSRVEARVAPKEHATVKRASKEPVV